MPALDETLPVIVARDVEKHFTLNRRGSEIGLQRKRHSTKVAALNSVSFAVSAGESVGVIGRNGSGKSTLLSLIAGHLKPSSGEIRVRYQPTLLTVNTAQMSQLSGRDNIKLGLLAKGLAPQVVEKKLPEVEEWADIGNAIARPLGSYSSGQRARLNFAIATAVEADILLVDEALSTGDAAFSFKAKQRMRRLLENSGVVFIVSHAPGTIEQHCNRCLWLHEGDLIADGPTKTVTYHYKNWVKLCAHPDKTHAAKYIESVRESYEKPIIRFASEL